ncbi:MAG TPA: flagellar motor protein MotB [Hydrogenothermaceae bacterium]|nr:flagellar motor protein MotB [Hydrogenothermaceae bacterium]
MPRKKKQVECKTIPAWLISFGDLMSLVLTFFILLFSMGTISLERFHMVIKGFTEYLGGRKVFLEEKVLKESNTPIEFKDMYPRKKNKRQKLQKALAELRESLQKAGIYAEIESHGSKIRFRVNTDKMFPIGSAKPLRFAVPYILEICKRLKIAEFPLVIEGHTDSTGSYEFNLELSLARALSVMKIFQKCGYPKKLMFVRGYGPFRPIASNKTAKGRAKNRRVEFVIETKDF